MTPVISFSDNGASLSLNRGQRRYARAKGLATYLDSGISSVWHWVKTKPGFPQPLKFSDGVTLFDLDAVDEFVAAQSQQAAKGAV